MAKLLVKIEIPGRAETLRQEIAAAKADPVGTESWFSKEDGDRILVDSAYLNESRADDSFYALEFVDVED